MLASSSYRARPVDPVLYTLYFTEPDPPTHAENLVLYTLSLYPPTPAENLVLYTLYFIPADPRQEPRASATEGARLAAHASCI